jgi:RNA polymerase sigma factor (TIGR02999 family)
MFLSKSDMSEVTRMLEAVGKGEPKAADSLLALVYEELRRLAAHKMANETPGQTLQPTALVHEAWLRLAGGDTPKFTNRAHFFAAAAEAMRRILIENARRRHARRHGGGQQRLDIQEVEIAAPVKDDELLAVDEALERLTAVNPQKAQLVKLRYFVGLTIEEAAEVMSVSTPTAKRWWSYARAWLYQDLDAQRAPQHPQPRQASNPQSD